MMITSKDVSGIIFQSIFWINESLKYLISKNSYCFHKEGYDISNLENFKQTIAKKDIQKSTLKLLKMLN